MKYERIVTGFLETNGYVIYDENTLQAFIIDPGDEGEKFSNYIEQNQLKLMGILLTHPHYDHIGALPFLRKKYNCPLYIHQADLKILKDPYRNGTIQNSKSPISEQANILLKDGDKIQAEGISLEVIHTPGHTEGSVCFKVEGENMVFTGDTIFNVDLGRTDLPGGSPEAMKESIQNKVSKWPDEIMIYPGHGDPASMGFVRKYNVEFLEMLNKK
ncbi:MAG TPA: MBL fold metallo-hydrolase [Clostridiales bacterium]|nr:MBL fold metallo-hydrolase [Clostridiales bacterium]